MIDCRYCNGTHPQLRTLGLNCLKLRLLSYLGLRPIAVLICFIFNNLQSSQETQNPGFGPWGFAPLPGTISNINILCGFRVLRRSFVRFVQGVSGWPLH